jgi:Tol biopolymer transport system component
MSDPLPDRLLLLRSTVAPLLAAALLAAGARAQQTTIESVDSSGTQGNFDSFNPSISSDGRFVAFYSVATNLVAGDNNRGSDVFLRDRSNGTTVLVSCDSAGVLGNDASATTALSADGTVVAFASLARNLVTNDTNAHADVFVRDLTTGVTERVSVDSSGGQGNGDSGYFLDSEGFGTFIAPSLSSDGRFVAFASFATNLVAGDTNGAIDIFVHDRVTGTTERVSVDSSGVQGDDDSDQPRLSADGNVVGFQSFASNLVAGDTNHAVDVFVHDRTTGATESVSVDPSGAQGNGESFSPSLSSTGEFVAFTSGADDLVSNDTNKTYDVFVRDRARGVTERVSVDASGNEANRQSGSPSLSPDGVVIAFWSEATNLVPGDNNMDWDVFVHDRGSNERVSVNSSGAEGNSRSFAPALTADLHSVAFMSVASNLVTGDTNQASDVFVHERCQTPASWSNYGAGFAGTLGVPAFTARANPALGTTLTLDAGNSLGTPTVGLLFIGLQRALLRSSWGGDLLLAPLVTQVIGIPSAGESFTGAIPPSETNCGVAVDLQLLEADPGAAFGVSFTQGLELIFGR